MKSKEKNKSKSKKKMGKLEKTIIIIVVILALCGALYKPFLEKFFIPHVHDKISQETKETPAKKYAKNLKAINLQLQKDDKNGKISNRFKYNKKPKLSSQTYDDGIYDNSKPLDLSYNYGKVKPANELDLSTMNPNYDKRLLVGHISMPAIGTNLPILEGVSNANLYAGAGTLKPYQKMGQGNYALASHFMPDGVSNFSKIGQLKKGNRILLTNGKKVYEYKTISVRNLPINSSSVVDDVKGKKLVTLVTCTDIYGNGRTVVQGEYIKKHNMRSTYGRYFKN